MSDFKKVWKKLNRYRADQIFPYHKNPNSNMSNHQSTRRKPKGKTKEKPNMAGKYNPMMIYFSSETLSDSFSVVGVTWPVVGASVTSLRP